MSEGKSVIDLGNLSQPATRLIEKISDAIGVVYEPIRVIKLAEAKAHAALIEYNSKNTISELESRALNRLLKREAKKQKNIEAITAKAISALPTTANPQEIEDDWISYFFSNCESISNEEMQRVWAEVLAREASTQNSFSRKTLSILATLESYDAECFTTLCSCVIECEGDPETYVFDIEDEFYRSRDINLGTALHLQSLGLIHFSNKNLYLNKSSKSPTEVDGEHYYIYKMRHFEKEYELLIPEEESPGLTNDSPMFEYGCISLTTAGIELFKICHPTPIENFMNKVGARFKKANQILKQVI
ncbi:DUF2806 domain-containing protein [Pseudomonas sp. URMO17WK12:I4]|uniref:DUF2806 domain-containing protein n=1 Tax=Pseudomonas sp. URMO17WK12:I4 TaxID=1283292 RepID=UPI0009DD3691|nr:DUF2806 domain-containing protein [Pseudomonas sp. URMO17WK12:I4]